MRDGILPAAMALLAGALALAAPAAARNLAKSVSAQSAPFWRAMASARCCQHLPAHKLLLPCPSHLCRATLQRQPLTMATTRA